MKKETKTKRRRKNAENVSTIVSLYRVLSKIFPNAAFGQKGLKDTEIQINQSLFITHTFFGFHDLRRTAERLHVSLLIYASHGVTQTNL